MVNASGLTSSSTAPLFDPNYVAVVAFLAAFILFLLMREVFAWYWKTNEIIKLLKEIKENTSPNKVPNKNGDTNPVAQKELGEATKTS
jgi:hypothetical protein